MLLIILYLPLLYGQQSNLIPNSETPLVSPNFSNLSVVSSKILTIDQFSDKNNVIDSDLGNNASWTYIIGSSAWLEVKDNNATGSNEYPAGSEAGFIINDNSIDLLGSIKLTTYLGTTEQESKTGSSLLGLGILGGKAKIGFTTTKNFDRIRISFSALGVAGTINIYYAYVVKYVTGDPLSCNENNSYSRPNYPVGINPDNTGLEGVAVGSLSNVENTIDGDNSTFATMVVNVGVLNGACKLSVKDHIDSYSAGHFVGFDISSDDLLNIGLLSQIEIRTYMDGSQVETHSNTGLIASVSALSGSNRNVVGFIAQEEFNEVQLIIYSGVINFNLGETKVYGVVIKEFCEGDDLVCNTNVPLSVPEYPVFIDKTESGVVDIGLGSSVSDLDKILTTPSNDYATITRPLGSIKTVNITLKKELSNFDANTFAGFDIEFDGLVDLGILSSVTVSLLNDDVLVATASNTNLIAAGIPLLSGTGRGVIGIVGGSEYNTIRLSIDFGLIDVGVLSNIKIYGVVVKSFCNGDALECNLPTKLTNPDYPVYVDGQHTGISGGISSGTINNVENAIDSDVNSAGTINFIASVASTASIMISDALSSYDAGTFAGIDISTNSLLDATILNNMTIKLFNNGSEVQSSTSLTTLVNVNTALLSDSSRLVIGTMADQEYDAIMLEINQPVNINIGHINVYGAIFEEMCAAQLTCYESSMLQYGKHPVIINHQRTGVLGVVNVGSEIRNPGNVLDADNSKYGELTSVAGVLSDVSLSVLNVLQEYPVGTFAGFVIEKDNGIIDLSLLNSISIKTYNNGVLQESKSGSDLINLTLLIQLIGPGSDAQNIGFNTSKSFDEIQISLGEFVSVGVVTTIKVYGAFIDTRTAFGGSLMCVSKLPDFAVGYKNMVIDGNVSINDNVPDNTTYGNPIPRSGNPSSIVPIMNSDGSYTFTPDKPGVYKFDVPVCAPDQSGNCPTEVLTITVLDDESGSNPPVANDDVAFVFGSDSAPPSISINVRANDRPGNSGGTLSVPIITTDSNPNGTVSIDGNGHVIYTPSPGFYGIDTFRYIITDPSISKSDTATVWVYVFPENIPNTTFAYDCFDTIKQNKTLTVGAADGLLSNSFDPEGDIQSVTAGTSTIPGKGTITINSDGSYSFVPVEDYFGPVEIPFEVSDNNSPSAVSTATLHIMVYKDGIPLPISLTSFYVKNIDCKRVDVYWESAMERNVFHFEIQFSLDGISFSTIRNYKANNSLIGNKYYVVLDNILKNGYIRLKTIDIDGNYSFSHIEAIQLPCNESSVTTYPNPTIDYLNVDGLSGDNIITIFDNTGKKIFNKHVYSDNTIQLNLKDLSSGVYNIVIVNNYGWVVENKRFVIVQP